MAPTLPEEHVDQAGAAVEGVAGGGEEGGGTGGPVWRRRYFQVLVVVLVGLAVASFVVPPVLLLIYQLRSVLLPVTIALGLAYVVNPAITMVFHKYNVPRWAGAGGVLALGALVVATFLLLALPPLVSQGTELFLKLKDVYPRKVADWLNEPTARRSGHHDNGTSATTSHAPSAPASALTPPRDTNNTSDVRAEGGHPSDKPGRSPGQKDVQRPTPSARSSPADWLDQLRDPQQARQLLHTLAAYLKDLNWSQVASVTSRSLDIGVGVVGSAISFTSYLALAAVVIIFCFFCFAWRFDVITAWFVPFIPVSRRETTLGILRRMDRSISAFIRGRLIQAFVMMMILSVGWLIVGVPYWLLLGVLSGVLNLVPFAAVVGWFLATVLTVIDHATGAHGLTIWTLAGPTLVYLIAQFMDGWVVEPIVQGKATDLDPLSVLLAVLIGGSLAGLLGLLIAIPTTACLKILAKELLLPKLRTLAAAH